MLSTKGIHLATYATALLFPAAMACATIEKGYLDDYIPSLVYDSTDGSLALDTGAGYGGPGTIYNVSVYSEYGIFYPIHASPYTTWYAYDTQLVTLTNTPFTNGTVIADPGFMDDGEQESWLWGDLSFYFQTDPFGVTYYGDLVYLEPTPDLPGDQDEDGFVGLADLDIILGDWNQNVPSGSPPDPTGDGFVGLADLDVVLGNWNAGTPPTTTVPEPATAALLATALGVCVWRRK